MPTAGASAGRSPGRPRADTDPDTRARTLLAAQIQFGERGYAGVSMDQLAEAAGVNVRAIYHYFDSKRALFEAATEAAFAEFAGLVLGLVFVHEETRARLHGFVEVYRVLYREQRHLLALISVMSMESIAEARRTERRRASDTAMPPAGAQPILELNKVFISAALERGDLAESVSPDAAVALLQTVAMGLGLATLAEDDTYLPMLDALDLLIDGTLLTGP